MSTEEKPEHKQEHKGRGKEHRHNRGGSREHRRGEREQRRGAGRRGGGRMSRFLEPRLLLYLAQKEQSYGYELIERIGDLGFETEPVDPGAIYRNLRGMEKRGLVTSEWETQEAGPARRLYRLMPDGEEMLHGWAASVRQRKEALEHFLEAYDAHCGQTEE